MKKFLTLVAILVAIIPCIANAKSYNFNGYYCDQKRAVGDGTFYMTCHIVATTDFDINHIKGTLILKNVKLESIRTNGNWQSVNGLSSNVEFTSSTNYNGSFAVADLVFTGNLNDKDCEASFMPNIAELTNNACRIIDNIYYGKNGNTVSKVAYYEECSNYVCTVVDNEYYFDSKGKSVSYNEMLNDCSTTEIVNPQTGIDYGYIILPIGIISLLGMIKLGKKNTKIYKI